MTAVEFEIWMLWMRSDSATAHGKCWDEWYALPIQMQLAILKGHLP